MTTWWDNAQSQTEETWTCRNISLSTSKVHIGLFFLYFFVVHTLSHTVPWTFIVQQWTPFFWMKLNTRGKRCAKGLILVQGLRQHLSVSHLMQFFFLRLSAVRAWLNVWVHLPWECLHWKHVAKRKEVVKLKPSVVRRWAEDPLPAAMNGSFRTKCTVAGRAAPYPPKEERWKCVRERGW